MKARKPVESVRDRSIIKIIKYRKICIFICNRILYRVPEEAVAYNNIILYHLATMTLTETIRFPEWKTNSNNGRW